MTATSVDLNSTAQRTSLPLVDVLTSMPVEGALFTTYTLSLAWFEAYMLRSLERSGATRILVLADPTGVNGTLSEGLVTGPGIRYDLEPVDAPNGAFHSKIALLWSRERLLLAVGSGNLTYAGMHRNLEAWEVLTAGIAEASPERSISHGVGESLLAFLSHLSTRVDPGGRAIHGLTDAITTVQSWLPRLSPEDSSVRWLDSTKESIGEQLARHLQATGNRKLQVLSPFHDRDGRAVIRIADALAATQLEVLYTGASTSFPLNAKSLADRRIESRRLVVDDVTRPLHAKVLRITDDTQSFVLSGSANATTKALWTTGNIEVSLLRRGNFDALLETLEGSPEIELSDFPTVEPRPFSILWARAADKDLRLKLRWFDCVPPDSIEISFVDTLHPSIRFTWPADDVLTIPFPSGLDGLHLRALRVQAKVLNGEIPTSARAWISFDELLSAPREFRAALSALDRLQNGDGDGSEDENDALLLQVFADHHARTVAALGSGVPFRKRGGSLPKDEETVNVTIPLQLLDAFATTTALHNASPGSTSSSYVEQAEHAMRALFRKLEERPDVDLTDDTELREPRSEPKAREVRLPKTIKQALNAFEQTVVDHARAISEPPGQSDLVLGYLLLCAQLVFRYRLKDTGDRVAFWASANRMVSVLLAPSAERGPLASFLLRDKPLTEEATRLFALLLALLAWRNSGGLFEGDAIHSQLQDEAVRSRLREALATLDRASVGPLPPAPLPLALDAVFPESSLKLEEILAELRATECGSDRILKLQKRIDAVVLLHENPLPSDHESVRAGRRRPPRSVLPWTSTCPACHQVLAQALRGPLLKREPAKCRNSSCGIWLIPSEGT